MNGLIIIGGIVAAAFLLKKKPAASTGPATLIQPKPITQPAGKVTEKPLKSPDREVQIMIDAFNLTTVNPTYNGLTAQQLVNIHALPATPEQVAAGAVPLAGNYREPVYVPIAVECSRVTVASLQQYVLKKNYPVTLLPPYAVPNGAVALIDAATGAPYGFVIPSLVGGKDKFYFGTPVVAIDPREGPDNMMVNNRWVAPDLLAMPQTAYPPGIDPARFKVTYSD